MKGRRTVLAVLAAACTLGLSAAAVRPARDVVGFCWDRETMNQLVDILQKTRPLPKAAPGWVAAICPHDDYLYAGRLYLPVYARFKAPEVVIIGVTHGRVRRALGNPQGRIILDTHRLWAGLGQPVQISGLREWLDKRLSPEELLVSDKAHEMEHSIEAMIPFLQHFRPDVRITPIMVTAMSPSRLAELSRELARHVAAWMRSRGLQPGRDVVFVISADGNHYGPDFDNAPFGTNRYARTRAEGFERSLIQECLQGKLNRSKLERLQRALNPGLTKNAPLWCGRYSIPFGLMTVLNIVEEWSGNEQLHGRLLGWSDTWQEGVLPLRHTALGITAPFSLEHWVSFFSMAFYLGPMD